MKVNNNYTAIILEGECREQEIINNLMKNCLKKDKYKIISLSANLNIYMLWLKLKEDLYETDIIEVVKEISPEAKEELVNIDRNNISEVILFFDYDAHQSNLPKDVNAGEVMKNMLKTFSNETELGKLYISYPMVEALRDYMPQKCVAFTQCIYHFSEFSSYKQKSGLCNPMVDIKNYDFSHWKEIINIFALRLSCLFDKKEVMSFQEYRDLVTPYEIYNRQLRYIETNNIFILSGFPEYLLDYFRVEFWNTCIKRKYLAGDKNCVK